MVEWLDNLKVLLLVEMKDVKKDLLVLGRMVLQLDVYTVELTVY